MSFFHNNDIMEVNNPADDVNNKKRQASDTSADTIKSIISFILDRCKNENGVMVPARGTIVAASVRFKLSKQAISRFWVRAKANHDDPDVAAYRSSPKKKGRKEGECQKWDRCDVSVAISKLPPHQSRTIRAMAAALGIPSTTLFNMYSKDKIIRQSTSHLRPTLTDANMFLRSFMRSIAFANWTMKDACCTTTT